MTKKWLSDEKKSTEKVGNCEGATERSEMSCSGSCSRQAAESSRQDEIAAVTVSEV